jgi:hypothetical protein
VSRSRRPDHLTEVAQPGCLGEIPGFASPSRDGFALTRLVFVLASALASARCSMSPVNGAGGLDKPLRLPT